LYTRLLEVPVLYLSRAIMRTKADYYRLLLSRPIPLGTLGEIARRALIQSSASRADASGTNPK
jgi:Fic family protein